MRCRSRYSLVLFGILAASTIVTSQPAAASELAYDGFSPSFPVVGNGGTGFSAAWAGSSGYFTPLASSLCYARLPVSPGSISASSASPVTGTFASRNLSQPLGTDNSTVYLSFLVQPRGPLSTGVYEFFGLSLSGSLNTLFIGKPGMDATEQYVLETYGGAGQVPSGSPVVAEHTALLVVKAQFLPGNDVFTLYINPTPGRPEPSSGVVKSDLDLGLVSSLSVGGVVATSQFTIDEIRIGTTYADVVPAAANPFSNPADCAGEGF